MRDMWKYILENGLSYMGIGYKIRVLENQVPIFVWLVTLPTKLQLVLQR